MLNECLFFSLLCGQIKGRDSIMLAYMASKKWLVFTNSVVGIFFSFILETIALGIICIWFFPVKSEKEKKNQTEVNRYSSSDIRKAVEKQETNFYYSLVNRS